MGDLNFEDSNGYLYVAALGWCGETRPPALYSKNKPKGQTPQGTSGLFRVPEPEIDADGSHRTYAGDLVAPVSTSLSRRSRSRAAASYAWECARTGRVPLK